VFGSKGGVGTTTLAANLAVSLATMESSPTVALIDMKPIFGEISMLLNVDTHFSWIDVTNNISRLDTTYLMSVLTKHSSGVYVLPSPVELSDDHANNPHPHALATLMRLMQTIFDFIVVDNGQSFDDTSREIMKTSGAVLIVCELSLPCIVNVKRLLDTFKKCGFPEEDKVGIVVNRFVKNSEISIKEAGKSLNKEIMFNIPNEYAIAINAINQGKPFSEMAQGSEISKKYKELANIFLASDKEKRLKKKSFSLSTFFNRS
jgi:pilus assembly protein CpaE